jgi:hypothetical protein
VRLRGETYNRIMELADYHDRPIANEVERLLELALDPPYKNQRRAMILDLIYETEGIFGLVRHLINTEGNPSEHERVERAASARNAATPPRYEWLPPDKPRYTDEYDEKGNLVSTVDLDEEGKPIPATRRFK